MRAKYYGAVAGSGPGRPTSRRPEVRMLDEEYFREKICVVTGAASGIGFALARELLMRRAVVMLADRDSTLLQSALEQLPECPGRPHPAVVDVTSQSQVETLLRDTASHHGRLDMLFNNAGIGGTMPIGEATLEHWRRIIDVNLWGVIHGIHAALPIMRRQGSGHIVNTASLAALFPFPYQALYCATKYGVLGLSECLRTELAAEGIYFSAACPGDVATRIYGTPIIGERVDVRPPINAMGADEAARMILEGVAHKEGIIIVAPRDVREWVMRYRPLTDGLEDFLRGMASERRRSYESKGTYY